VSGSLVLQTSFLGDVVLTTPLLAELARRGPVDVVVTPQAAPILAGHPSVRAVITYDKRGAQRGLGGAMALGRSLRARGYDAVYCAQGSWRTAAIAALSTRGARVGFDTSAGGPLYSRRITYQREQHHAERLWRLAAGNDAPALPELIRPRLYPGEPERAAVDALLASAPPLEHELIALAPGSVWATKRWPAYAGLAARLASRYRLVVVGGKDDAPLAAAIASSASADRVIDATGRLSLLASAELLRRCAALVTNDSAPQHLASAVDTPTLTIFGPTVPAFGFGPLAQRHRTAGRDRLDCRPCDPHGPAVCPLGHWRCMQDIEVGHIAGDLQALLTP
jgi:heptosyltransferase-2